MDISRVTTLWDAIKHGDEEHRAWLKEAIDAHFAGKPIPEPRGKGVMTHPSPPVSDDGLLPDDKCAICGKIKMQHNMNCGVGMCRLYPSFVSEREMFDRLTRAAPSVVVER